MEAFVSDMIFGLVLVIAVPLLLYVIHAVHKTGRSIEQIGQRRDMARRHYSGTWDWREM